MKEFNINDRVYRFCNGKFDSVYKVVEITKDGYGVIRTDVLINGEEPTVSNSTIEHYDRNGEARVGFVRLTIHKETEDMKQQLSKYQVRMCLIQEISKMLGVDKSKRFDNGKGRELLLTKTDKQLFALFTILACQPNGKFGTCRIKDDGQLGFEFFVKEDIVNTVEEPKD